MRKEGENMVTIILLIVLLVTMIEWALAHITALALLRYMEMQGYTLPNDAELREHVQWTIKHIFAGNKYNQ